MMRASFLAIAAAVASLALMLSASSSTTGCNDVQTTDPPDGALPPCNQGPFAFPAALGGDQVGTAACSSDDNPSNLPVILKLPRGGRYGVGTTVNYVGTRDPQGDCNLETVCKCITPVTGTTTTPPAVDAGPDAAPAPAPTPTTGVPTWTCQ